jgi:hypothetical protein
MASIRTGQSLGSSKKSELLATILALETWPTQVEAFENLSTSSCTACSRFCHQNGPLQRQGSFRAIPLLRRHTVQYNLGARDCDSEKTAVYMIDVLNRMCSGGCATYVMSV